MGYMVQGRLEVSVYINNVEFPLDTLNVLNYCHIAWWTRGILPTFRIGLFDARHTLDLIELQDGIPIRVVIKPLSSPTMTFNFRKHNHHKSFNGNGFIYDIDGYMDCPMYWAGTSSAGIQGTSSEALSAIATKCGLTFQGVSTNDPQLWMQRSRTYGEFAFNIKKRGWASATSYMESNVGPDNILRYVDVMSLPPPTQKITLGVYAQGSYTAADYLPKAKSGLPNKMTGYQNTRYAQSMTGTALSTPNQNITFTPDSKSPLFNTAMPAAIGNRGYQSYGGIDVGNTHENYETAIYQNMRFANLFSLDVEFLIQTPTTLAIFDTFTFAVDQEANKQDAAYAGTYIVAGRALAITGANYSEKILGTRQGTNLPYTSG